MLLILELILAHARLAERNPDMILPCKVIYRLYITLYGIITGQLPRGISPQDIK